MKSLRMVAALAGGLLLSFLAFGLLWIGTPWPLQALMLVPFFLLAFAVAWTGEPGNAAGLTVAYGAAPLGAIMMMFRDKSDSHLMPILVVLSWLAGILAGHFLAAALRKRRVSSGDAHTG